VTTWKPDRPTASQREPTRVGESLDRVTGAIGAPKATTLSAVFARWEALVGEEIAAHAVPRSLRDGLLLVEVDQPAWAAQLGFLSSRLLSRFDTEVGPGEVRDIRFRVVGSGPAPASRKGR
jgi:predicted nucleic acid-binding Zn ribbon protein